MLMVTPVFCGWYFRCPICGCVAYEDDHTCFACGEPFDWTESDTAEEERK